MNLFLVVLMLVFIEFCVLIGDYLINMTDECERFNGAVMSMLQLQRFK